MAEKTITVIPARKRVGSRKQVTEEKPKLRVAAYCRVSTDRDEQESSYEAQVEHYTEFIDRNPEWQLAGIYADDGISGTNTKKREEFNRMIEDCMASKIDMVITKSISRFARNTLDCLKYIRQLKEKNISVYFEKENINTMDAKGEVLLTIMASLAQQESQSLSQNVKLGLRSVTKPERSRSTTTASSAIPRMMKAIWSSSRKKQKSSCESIESIWKVQACFRSDRGWKRTASRPPLEVITGCKVH